MLKPSDEKWSVKDQSEGDDMVAGVLPAMSLSKARLTRETFRRSVTDNKEH